MLYRKYEWSPRRYPNEPYIPVSKPLYCRMTQCIQLYIRDLAQQPLSGYARALATRVRALHAVAGSSSGGFFRTVCFPVNPYVTIASVSHNVVSIQPSLEHIKRVLADERRTAQWLREAIWRWSHRCSARTRVASARAQPLIGCCARSLFLASRTWLSQ